MMPVPLSWCIAQSDESSRSSVEVIVSLGYLVGAALLVGLAFWAIRKWVMRGGQDQSIASGFTLAELRQLHRNGELTDEQFASAKAALIAHGLAAMGGLGDEEPTPEADESNASALSDGSITSGDDGSSDKSGDGPGGDDAPPKRDE
jgi:hypothetical protein